MPARASGAVFLDRLRDLAKSMPQKAIAAGMGIRPETVSGWLQERERVNPVLGTIEALARVARVDPAYLISDAVDRQGRPAPALELDGADYATLRLSLRAAAGSPIFEDVEGEGMRLAFRRDWLARWCPAGISEECVYLVRVQGDSMEPTIPDGSVALIRRYPPDRDEPIVSGRPYLIQVPEDEYGRAVKRLALDASGTLVAVSSDNPRYPPYILRADEYRGWHGVILGRVIWYGVDVGEE